MGPRLLAAKHPEKDYSFLVELDEVEDVEVSDEPEVLEVLEVLEDSEASEALALAELSLSDVPFETYPSLYHPPPLRTKDVRETLRRTDSLLQPEHGGGSAPTF